MVVSVYKKNNLNFLRLLFSSLVIVSHSYALTNNPEILSEITNGQLSFGGSAVNVFFVISGFLILNSLKLSKSPQNYIWKRCLRLFPALIVMLVFSLIVICLVYQGTSVFLEREFYTYLPNNLSLYLVQYEVHGVFEYNPYPKAINGSLWSLCYEFSMYIFVLCLFVFRKNTRTLQILLIISFALSVYAINWRPHLFANIYSFFNLDSVQLYRLSSYFIGGSLLTFVDVQKYNNLYVRFALFIVLVAAVQLNFYEQISFLVLPMLVIMVGLSYSSALDFIPHKIGDISYGVYIYGFIVQQTLMHFYAFNPYVLALLSLLITYPLSYMSWHLIEKKCLKYKNYI